MSVIASPMPTESFFAFEQRAVLESEAPWTELNAFLLDFDEPLSPLPWFSEEGLPQGPLTIHADAPLSFEEATETILEEEEETQEIDEEAAWSLEDALEIEADAAQTMSLGDVSEALFGDDAEAVDSVPVETFEVVPSPSLEAVLEALFDDEGDLLPPLELVPGFSTDAAPLAKEEDGEPPVLYVEWLEAPQPVLSPWMGRPPARRPSVRGSKKSKRSARPSETRLCVPKDGNVRRYMNDRRAFLASADQAEKLQMRDVLVELYRDKMQRIHDKNVEDGQAPTTKPFAYPTPRKPTAEEAEWLDAFLTDLPTEPCPSGWTTARFYEEVVQKDLGWNIRDFSAIFTGGLVDFSNLYKYVRGTRPAGGVCQEALECFHFLRDARMLEPFLGYGYFMEPHGLSSCRRASSDADDSIEDLPPTEPVAVEA